MYERFFGFEEAPFRLTPDPRYLFLSAKHKEALGHLVYGLEEGAGFVAITGEIGAGKTTILRSFLSDPPENARYAYILNPVLSGVELLQEINHELGLREEGTQRDLLVALNTFLLDQKQAGNQVVLVIDEAQALGGAILEQLRMLSNFETESAKLLQIVLVGQPELRDILARPDLVQLEQRITVRWHLGPLDREETGQYIGHRLATASGGRPRRILSSGAQKRVFAYSQGIPRRINVVCHRALLVAYARDSTSITSSIVKRAIEEIESPRRRRSEPTRRIPQWAAMAAGLVLAAFLGGAGVWGFNEFGARSISFTQEPGRAASSDSRDVAQMLDAIDRVPAAPLPAAASEPRVAPHPLTPSFEPWPAGQVDPPVAAVPVSHGYVPPGGPMSVVAAEPEVPAPVPDSRWIERAALSDALRQTTASESAYEAVESLVGVWNGDRLSAAEAASHRLDLPAIARRRGLDYLEFTGNLNVLRVLDLPVILELDLGDGSGVHFGMVDRVDDRMAYVRLGQERIEVSHSVLSEVWFGQGHVLWYDVEKLGSLLSRGIAGAKVRRLHDLLQVAGVYEGPGGDQFDALTEEAVVEFQRGVHLEADGKVGPMTMIALYGMAASDRVPHLGSQRSKGAPANVIASGAVR
ncbi:MAG: AAA family ATPase [Candidatus Binatia bacterium]|nr:AAA family ATPase [Candidatus Binatia bacterium]